MQRHNFFSQYHKVIQARLYDTALNLPHVDAAFDETAFLKKLNKVLNLFNIYSNHIANNILVAIDAYEPSIADAFRQDGERVKKLSNTLLKNFYGQSEEYAVDKTVNAIAFSTTYMELMRLMLLVMDKENTVINPILWRYYTDDEIRYLELQTDLYVQTDNSLNLTQHSKKELPKEAVIS